MDDLTLLPPVRPVIIIADFGDQAELRNRLNSGAPAVHFSQVNQSVTLPPTDHPIVRRQVCWPSEQHRALTPIVARADTDNFEIP
jgi:hypothetical protein